MTRSSFSCPMSSAAWAWGICTKAFAVPSNPLSAVWRLAAGQRDLFSRIQATVFAAVLAQVFRGQWRPVGWIPGGAARRK
ncbi:UNVERIFIED_ORG: hypothetical protein J2X79_000053 [Arthrobacter globiformis]|nr:hypothetical protein [Arthrobacter globiformis]